MPNVVQIQPAIVPDDPVRPRTMLNSVLGGIIALILSAGFLILKENLDTTMKTSAQVEELLKLNVIGYIAEMQNSNGETIGLYTTNQPRSPIAEAFRSLRTNIEFSSIDKPIRTILVTSPEVSTGKTIISTNLAAIYAQKGEKVLLLDADLRRPRVHKTMGITNHIGLTDLLRGSHDLQDVIQKMDGAENLTIVSSGSLPPNPAELLGSARMELNTSRVR